MTAAPSDPRVLGIDLGGTKILTAVVDPRGKLLSRDHSITPATENQDAVLQAIFDSARQVLDQAGLDAAQLAGIGIGAPGPSDPQAGVLFSSPNLPGLRNIPLSAIIEKEFGPKTVLINDGNAAALAEFHLGAGRGACCFIYVTVSTGIGGGMVIDGKNYTGARGLAAEFGHMTIEDSGPPCNCGNVGCWESLASGTALAREAQRRIDEGAATAILQYAEDETGQVSAVAVHRAAQAGDRLAQKLVLRTAHYLGTGLANLLNLFNPDVIAIGGGLANMGEMLLEPAYAVAKKRAFLSAFESVRFVRAELGRNSGVLGAAAYALREIAGIDMRSG